MSTSDNRRGIVAMLLAVALFSVMDAGLKLMTPHYPPMQIAALRGLSSLPLVTLWIVASGQVATLLRVRWPLHLLRGVLGILMMAAFTYALATLPLSGAYGLFFIAPLLITALSGPLLGERVGRHRWLAIGGGFAGVLVMLRPSGEGLLTLAGLAVLLSATGYAVSAITVRVLVRSDSRAAIVFWLMAQMGLGAAALAAPAWVPLDPAHYAIIAGIGVCGTLGQIAITEAFARGEASLIAPLEYSALAWAMGFDLLLWQTLPDGVTLTGAGIIVAAGLYLLHRERSPVATLPENG